MIRQCAWCCHVLGQIPPLEDPSVTHGLCPACHASLLETQESIRLRCDRPDSSPSHILSPEIAQ
jgi:hypothetical protein